MFLFEPPLSLHSGDELAGIELRLKFVENRRIDASWRTLLGTGFVTLEKGFEPARPYRRQPAEKVSAGDAAKIGDLRGSVFSPSGELDGEQPVFAPTVLFGSMFLINDGGHIGPAQSERGFCHAHGYQVGPAISLYLCDMV